MGANDEINRALDTLLARDIDSLGKRYDRSERIQSAKDEFIERKVDYYIDHESEFIQRAKDLGLWDDYMGDLAARIAADHDWTPAHACEVA